MKKQLQPTAARPTYHVSRFTFHVSRTCRADLSRHSQATAEVRRRRITPASQTQTSSVQLTFFQVGIPTILLESALRLQPSTACRPESLRRSSAKAGATRTSSHTIIHHPPSIIQPSPGPVQSSSPPRRSSERRRVNAKVFPPETEYTRKPLK
jgi:hypothetical protein